MHLPEVMPLLPVDRGNLRSLASAPRQYDNSMTPTEQGLLAAIPAQPNDPFLRLIYADWLEAEAGGDGPRRGAYLRAWCAMLPILVRDLDRYSEAAEALEALAAGLPAEWIAAVEATRFHLGSPHLVITRAETFFLRYGGSAELIDARPIGVFSTGGDWEVRYSTGAMNTRFLTVERATGRVHMIDSRGRRIGTHHPDTLAPS